MNLGSINALFFIGGKTCFRGKGRKWEGGIIKAGNSSAFAGGINMIMMHD